MGGSVLYVDGCSVVECNDRTDVCMFACVRVCMSASCLCVCVEYI